MQPRFGCWRKDSAAIFNNKGSFQLKLYFSKSLWYGDCVWSKMLTTLLAKSMKIDFMMNWFSTMGGGHSQLAAKNKSNAVQAGLYALKMMKVCHDVGDRVGIIRCGLYVVISLFLQGRADEGELILSFVDTFAKYNRIDYQSANLQHVYLVIDRKRKELP
eukprot:m.38361 g.38361  ORF g.38361 m.38361 type:complete len:160 (+) comp10212_c0_seq1:600-1079(+)